jgi:hypothetical protein
MPAPQEAATQANAKEPLMRVIGDRARASIAPFASGAFGLLAPFAMVPDSWADAVADAMEWIGEDRIVAIATAANALTTLL